MTHLTFSSEVRQSFFIPSLWLLLCCCVCVESKHKNAKSLAEIRKKYKARLLSWTFSSFVATLRLEHLSIYDSFVPKAN
jgi:hypothetical protein